MPSHLSLKLSAPDVITVVTDFLKEHGDSHHPKITSVEANEVDSKWLVVVDVADVGVDRRELIVDDRDGKIISYKHVWNSKQAWTR
jgi:hypothetical protein